jgi:hypothetical protein
MAVEAQLCPQCGGSIQFAAYQTQVICPYCGTTVDKPQPLAASATSLRGPRLSDLPKDKLIQLTRMVFASQQADALAFIRQNLGLDEAQARKQLADEDQWLPRLGVIAPDQLMQLGRMVFDGQRAEVLAFIQQHLGLDEAHASTQLDAEIVVWCDQWRYKYQQKPPGLLAVFKALAKPTSATLLKVVKLKTGRIRTGPIVTTTHLQVQVAPHTGAPQIINRVLDLPPETADVLQPGTKIEVITNGPDIVYVTEPIKVVG